ncbi:hypothetical protein ABK040_003673 [Willaertia magna]
MNETTTIVTETIKAFSFTFVVYEKGNILSFLYACGALIPIVIVISLATIVFVNREYQSGFVLFGILLNEICNHILKHSIAEQRPYNILVAKFRNISTHTESTTELVENYGMPSSHTQFMFFFTITVLCWFKIKTPFIRKLTVISLLLLSLFVAYSRIAMHFHTPLQVLGGAILGIMNGFIWRLIYFYIFKPKIIPFLESIPFITDTLSFHSNEHVLSTVDYQNECTRSSVDRKKKD